MTSNQNPMYTRTVPGGNELLNPEKILIHELNLTAGSFIGDFGCGSAAYFTLQAGKIVGDSGIVYAVDVLKDVLQTINTRAKDANILNIKTIWSDLEKFGATKINNDTLDFALIVNILFQNEDKKAVIREIARMVKAGGKILIIDWKEGRFQLGPTTQYKISPENVIQICQELNLQLIKRFEAGQYHYGLIFEK